MLEKLQDRWSKRMYVCADFFLQIFLLVIPNWRHFTGKHLEIHEGTVGFSGLGGCGGLGGGGLHLGLVCTQDLAYVTLVFNYNSILST